MASDLLFMRYKNNLPQEPITRSLHLPYKHLESTLSHEKLFIEIAFAENLSHLNAFLAIGSYLLVITNHSAATVMLIFQSVRKHMYAFSRSEEIFDNNGGKHAGKPVLKIILYGNGLTQGYSTNGGS